MDLRQTEWVDVGWIYLAQNRDQWNGFANVVLSFELHKALGECWLGELQATSPEGLSSMRGL
jgi:hypothetical protein